MTETIQSMRRFLKESDVMAYLVMMTNRLLELHRVLKPTGSLYLHCDPTASHYLKIVLDAIFGANNFVNEIIWSYKRWPVKGDFFQRMHDTLLFYGKDNEADRTFNTLYVERAASTKKRWGQQKIKARHDEEGRRIPSVSENEKSLGVPMRDVWNVSIIAPSSHERLGYPTQKPEALLSRVIEASSNEGDVVLDPFCGCGTAIHVAEKLKRNWIGIDITHLAISLIESRIEEAFPGIEYEVHGVPNSIEGARELAEINKYEFQWWACSLVVAQPYKGKTKGADSGIDGLIFFQDDDAGAKKIIVSVKGGQNVGRSMIADLKNTVDREQAQIGLFVTLAEPTRPMIKEAVSAGYYDSVFGAFPKIQILTIEELLSGEKRPLYPDLSRGALNFKKAKVEEEDATQDELGI